MAVDPHILRFYQRLAKQLGALPPPEDVAAQRARFEAVAIISDHPDPDGVEVSDLSLLFTERTLDAIIFRPKSMTTPRLPVRFHGGEWVIGASRTTHHTLAVLLAQDTRCVVVSVDYRPALKHAFPAPADDARDTLVYLAKQRTYLGLASDFIVAGGGDTDGHLTVQAAQGIRSGLTNAQFLLYPVTTPAFGSESYSAFIQGPNLTRGGMRQRWEKYIGAEALAKPFVEQNPRTFLMARSPAYTPPDTAVIVAIHGVLCDDGLQYTDHLVQHGAQVIAIEASGVTHAFAHIQFEVERTRRWMRRTAHAFVGMISGK